MNDLAFFESIFDKEMDYLLEGHEAGRIKAEMNWPQVRAMLSERMARRLTPAATSSAARMIEHYINNYVPELRRKDW